MNEPTPDYHVTYNPKWSDTPIEYYHPVYYDVTLDAGKGTIHLAYTFTFDDEIYEEKENVEMFSLPKGRTVSKGLEDNDIEIKSIKGNCATLDSWTLYKMDYTDVRFAVGDKLPKLDEGEKILYKYTPMPDEDPDWHGYYIGGNVKVWKKGVSTKELYKLNVDRHFYAVANWDELSLKLSTTKYSYNGETKKPTVTVTDVDGNKLVKDTDYTVTYASGRKNVGRYKVTIKFKGKYSGTKNLYFTIVPKAPSSATARLSTGSQDDRYDDIYFSWKASTGATGYRVYYKKASDDSYTYYKSVTGTSVTKKNLTDGVKYTFKVIPYYKTSSGTTQYYSTSQYKTASAYTLKKLSTPTLSTSDGKVKVKWTNISGETGYQISRSTSKTGTNIVSTYATTSGTYKKVSATKGKTYYYKVRAYKTVDGEKVCGPWSEVKSYKR